MAKTLTLNGSEHILILAKRHIARGEEITYNYQFEK